MITLSNISAIFWYSKQLIIGWPSFALETEERLKCWKHQIYSDCSFSYPSHNDHSIFFRMFELTSSNLVCFFLQCSRSCSRSYLISVYLCCSLCIRRSSSQACFTSSGSSPSSSSESHKNKRCKQTYSITRLKKIKSDIVKKPLK